MRSFGPTNTYLERVAIDGGLNLSDGHARQPLFEEEAEIVARFGSFYEAAAATGQSEAERRFTEAFLRLAGEEGELPFLLSYSASSLVAVVATWLRDRGYSVAILEPGFDNIRDLLIRAGVATIPVEADAITGEGSAWSSRLPLRGRSALWLTLPNNPDGFSLPRREFAELASRCAEHDVLLICDFCFRFFSEEMTSWSQYETLIRAGCSFICLEDTGKTLPLLDIKVGMLRCSVGFERDLALLNEEVVLNVSPWALAVLTELLTAYEARSLERVVWVPTRRRGHLVDAWIEQAGFLPAGAPRSGAPFRWVAIPRNLPWDAAEFANRAAAKDVHILPGERFFFDPSHGRRFFRLPLSRPDGILTAGLARLAEVASDPVT